MRVKVPQQGVLIGLSRVPRLIGPSMVFVATVRATKLLNEVGVALCRVIGLGTFGYWQLLVACRLVIQRNGLLERRDHEARHLD